MPEKEPCNCGYPTCRLCYPFRRNADEWNDKPDPDDWREEQQQSSND